jgi:hypothetical protein
LLSKEGIVRTNHFIVCTLLLAQAPLVLAEEPSVLRDLEPLSPTPLTAAELKELLPGAKMTRRIPSGNTHNWTNDPDGTFIISSDNSSTTGRYVTARGTWSVSPDGRYCIRVEWSRSTDDWCRFVLRTTDGYYLVKALKPGTETVYPVRISK